MVGRQTDYDDYEFDPLPFQIPIEILNWDTLIFKNRFRMLLNNSGNQITFRNTSLHTTFLAKPDSITKSNIAQPRNQKKAHYFYC